MLAENVCSDQLNILRKICFRRPHPGQPLLDVVQKTLGERRVLIQVDQMRSLEKNHDLLKFSIRP